MTWAVGHLVQLAEPDEYDAKFKKWRMADLPIVPGRFKLVVRDERSKKQMSVDQPLLKRDDVDLVVNACDAGREGELIFAYLYEKAGAKKPVERLWLSSMTKAAIEQAFGAPAPGRELPRSRRPRARAREADWIVGMNATRAATIRLRSSFDGAVSLGRVQTPTLAHRRPARGGDPRVQARALLARRRALRPPTVSAVYEGRFHAGAQPRLKTAAEARGDRRGRRAARPATITKLEKTTQKERAAAALRPHLAAARGQQPLRLLGAAHARRRPAPLRGAHGADLSAHELALPDRRHGRRDQADRRARRRAAASTRAAAEYVTGLDMLPLGRVVNDAKVTDHHAIIPTNAPSTASTR